MDAPVVNKRQGYTLMEVLVAVVILGLVLPGLAGMVVSSRKTQTSSLRVDMASSVAQELLDSLQIIPFQALQPNTTSGACDATPNACITKTVAGVQFKSSYTRSGPRLNQILIRTRWTQAGKPHFIQLAGVVR